MGRFLLQFRRNQNWLLVRELKLSIVSGVTQCPQHPLKNPKGFGDVALQHWPNCDTYNLDTRIQHCRSLLIWALLRNNSFLEVNCSFFFPVDFFSIYELQYKVIMKMFLIDIPLESHAVEKMIYIEIFGGEKILYHSWPSVSQYHYSMFFFLSRIFYSKISPSLSIIFCQTLLDFYIPLCFLSLLHHFPFLISLSFTQDKSNFTSTTSSMVKSH